MTTLSQFFQESQQQRIAPDLSSLIQKIAAACRQIATVVQSPDFVSLQGFTGGENVYNEEVQKVDELSNDILFQALSKSGLVANFGSEELDQIIKLPGSGKHNVFVDPLAGSSNIDVAVPVGTIFSMYKNTGNVLQSGRQQVASGYVSYGSTVVLVFACSDSTTVNGFTLDTKKGEFMLSHPDMRIPESGKMYSINEGNTASYDPATQEYLDVIKRGDKPYQHRYVGSMAADIHRTLIKGGIFLYPAHGKAPNGKLRLMLEVNPISFLVEKAGGLATTGITDPLDILPESVTQRVPIIVGSRKEVEKYLEFAAK